jgi:H+-transporting ATPase
MLTLNLILKFGVRVILLLWNFDLPSLLALVIAAFNYCEFQLQKICNLTLQHILCVSLFQCSYSLPCILFPGTAFAILFERMNVSKSPDRWRVKKIIGSSVAFGSYIVLSTIIFSGLQH